MRRGITLLILIFALLISMQNKTNFAKSSSNTIPEDAIRLRILANSDEEVDQSIKEEVRDEVINIIYSKVEEVDDIEQARLIIYDCIEEIEQAVENVLTHHDLDTQYYVDYGLTNFPGKVYNNKLYPAGRYEAVYIVLGEGKGENWWCVLFPPLCLIDVSIENGTDIDENTEVKYDFLIIKKIKELFGYND